MRDNSWLEQKMYEIWEDHFNDIPRKNLVLIKFGKNAKRQLGSIRWVEGRTKVKTFLRKFKEKLHHQDDERITLITISSLFKDLSIPEYVIEATIAHEMIHYAHGFFSPLSQIYNHPHKGGIIRKEMEKRGLKEIYKTSKRWLKESWREYLKENYS